MADGLFGMTEQDVLTARQQQAQQNAFKMAQLDPQQLATYGASMAGSQLGSAVRGLFGGTDPELAKVTRFNQIISQIDLSDPTSIRQAAQELGRAGFTKEAMAFMDKAKEMDISESTLLKNRAEAAAKMREENPIKKLIETGKYTPKSIGEFAKTGDVGSLELVGSDDKTQVIETSSGQQLINSRTGEVIATFTGKPTKPSMASEIAAGMSPLVGALVASQAKKAGETSGADIGKQVAQIQTGYSADTALNDALNMVDKGIYAGGYGPLQEAASKYSKGVVGDKKRLVNTQEFKAYIGNVVIPMMAKLGGSDSNEELKYMRSIAGGETELEPEAIKAILQRAQKAVRNDVARVQQQYSAIQEGKPLPTGPVKTSGSLPRTATTKSGTKYTIED